MNSQIRGAREIGLHELTTVEVFNASRNGGRGFLVITDIATGNHIHRWDCPFVTPEFFREKVLTNNCRNGRYYQIEDVETAKQRFGASDCGVCKPSEQ